jgi:hypothetical protein
MCSGSQRAKKHYSKITGEEIHTLRGERATVRLQAHANREVKVLLGQTLSGP